MTKASLRVNFDDNMVNKIKKLLSSWDYSKKEMGRICPYLAQLFYDKGINIESTCLIFAEVIDEEINSKIDEIYSDNPHFPYLTTDLIEYIGEKRYDEIAEAISYSAQKPNSVYALDDSTHIVTSFSTKSIFQIKESNKKGVKAKETPIIEAVPLNLTVYDSLFLDLPRTFKITWTSHYSDRNFTTAGDGTGATITEISQYLIDAGFAISKSMVNDAITCMINSMIDDGFAEIKNTIDNKGVYYNPDTDEVIAVKLDTDVPTKSEMEDAIDVLFKLHGFFEDNSDNFSTVFKWSIMSIFSYAMKQAGNWLPYLYLKGTAGSGKTTLGKIALYLYGTPSVENNISGSSCNTDYRLGEAVSKDCTARIVNEPKAVFNRDSTNEMVKHCVEGLIARKIKGKVVSAFSPLVFTANQHLPDDDALVRRMVVLAFTHSQRKSEKQKKDFEKAFRINSNNSNLSKLQIFGKYAVGEILADPSYLTGDWQESADTIISKFFDEADVLKPSWLDSWAETETLEDYDELQIETIRSFFVDAFNKVRGSVDIRDEYGKRQSNTLDQISSTDYSDFEDLNWNIVNNRLLTWALPHVGRNGEQSICFTQNLKKDMGYILDMDMSLTSLSELLGWEYKVIKFNRKPLRVMVCGFKQFMMFLYPSGDIDD